MAMDKFETFIELFAQGPVFKVDEPGREPSYTAKAVIAGDCPNGMLGDAN